MKFRAIDRPVSHKTAPRWCNGIRCTGMRGIPRRAKAEFASRIISQYEGTLFNGDDCETFINWRTGGERRKDLIGFFKISSDATGAAVGVGVVQLGAPSIRRTLICTASLEVQTLAALLGLKKRAGDGEYGRQCGRRESETSDVAAGLAGQRADQYPRPRETPVTTRSRTVSNHKCKPGTFSRQKIVRWGLGHGASGTCARLLMEGSRSGSGRARQRDRQHGGTNGF